jgi:diguanylate cyclase (GGDEF)-like protein
MRTGFLVFKSTPLWRKFYKSAFGIELVELIQKTLLSVGKIVYLNNREDSSKRLFDMTRVFNSTMDTKIILDGLMKTVSDAFPQVSVDLLLSHEQKNLSHSFKLLDYMNERSLTMDAFVSGELTSEQLPDRSVHLLNAPIKGRQAIYGVVQLLAPMEHIFSTSKIEFLEVVSSTAGSALENARLYDQSHHLIKELKLVNETSRKLNDNLDYEQMIIFLKEQLLKAFKPDEIAFVFYNRQEKHKVSPASSSFFRTLLSTYYVEYASNYFVKEKTALFDANFGNTLREPVPYESYIAVPITNQDKVIGFVAMLHASNYYFAFDSFKLMQALISHSSLAFTNSILRDQLQELVDKDYLTRLFTRNYLDRMIEKSLKTDDRGVFLLMDVDNFKNVNDTYGHTTGDLVLKSISDCIQSEVGTKGVAARWGGEEIAIYLPFASEAEGISCSRTLLENIPLITNPSVTVSIGMKSWNSKDMSTCEELFHYADAALYSAKNNGKNQLNIYAASYSHE